MTATRELEIEGVRLFGVRDETLGDESVGAIREWRYLPEAPSIAPGTAGRPGVLLVSAGAQSFLTFTARLAATPAALETARRALAEHEHVPPAEIALRHAVAPPVTAEVLLREASEPVVVASSATSGLPPFDAAFSIRLEPEAAATVRSALEGERGLLLLRFACTLALGDSSGESWSHSSSSSSTTTTTTTTVHGGDTPVRAAHEKTETTDAASAAPPTPSLPPRQVVVELDGSRWLETPGR